MKESFHEGLMYLQHECITPFTNLQFGDSLRETLNAPATVRLLLPTLNCELSAFSYVCNTPVLNSRISGFSAADSSAQINASRVCAGSMIASTQRRAAA